MRILLTLVLFAGCAPHEPRTLQAASSAESGGSEREPEAEQPATPVSESQPTSEPAPDSAQVQRLDSSADSPLEQVLVAEPAPRQRIPVRIVDLSVSPLPSQGQFDESLVVRELRRRLRAIQRCVEQRITEPLTTTGVLSVDFGITAQQGTVEGAAAVEEVPWSSCVLGTIRRLRFSPGPSNTARFRVTVEIGPG